MFECAPGFKGVERQQLVGSNEFTSDGTRGDGNVSAAVAFVDE